MEEKMHKSEPSSKGTTSRIDEVLNHIGEELESQNSLLETTKHHMCKIYPIDDEKQSLTDCDTTSLVGKIHLILEVLSKNNITLRGINNHLNENI